MQILGIVLCMVFLIDLRTYPYQKNFPKKSVLKIFIILFEQDCPEAVVHDLIPALRAYWSLEKNALYTCLLYTSDAADE